LLLCTNTGGLIPGEEAIGNVFQYESSGRFQQHQLIVNLRTRFRDGLSLFANYTLNKADSDTDGVNVFPADSQDLRGEYGRSALDIRHQVIAGGSIELPWELRLSPFMVARSGVPFNITTGQDTNGDTLFTERPALAADLTRPSVVITDFGAFDLAPLPGQRIIPRNFGEGPGFFRVNLRGGKTFNLGGGAAASSGAAAQGAGGRRRGRGGGPWSQASRGRGGGSADSRYSLTLSLSSTTPISARPSAISARLCSATRLPPRAASVLAAGSRGETAGSNWSCASAFNRGLSWDGGLSWAGCFRVFEL
jgi:hypothetical protein